MFLYIYIYYIYIFEFECLYLSAFQKTPEPFLFSPTSLWFVTITMTVQLKLTQVTKDSNFEEAAEWIREGGRGIVVDHWRDFEICRKILLKPLRQRPATAEDAEVWTEDQQVLSICIFVGKIVRDDVTSAVN